VFISYPEYDDLQQLQSEILPVFHFLLLTLDVFLDAVGHCSIILYFVCSNCNEHGYKSQVNYDLKDTQWPSLGEDWCCSMYVDNSLFVGLWSTCYTNPLFS